MTILFVVKKYLPLVTIFLVVTKFLLRKSMFLTVIDTSNKHCLIYCFGLFAIEIIIIMCQATNPTQTITHEYSKLCQKIMRVEDKKN